MLGGRFLLLALALIVSMATNDLPYCSRSFIPQEWQKERESYLLNIAELEKHLQPQPYFLSKILLLTTGNPQSFLELVGTATFKVLPLNGLYLSICALVLFLMLAFYVLRKRHQFCQIPFLNTMLVENARKTKYLKLGIVFLLVLAAFFSLKGMNESFRQEKAINHILCRILSDQKFIQKNNTYIGHAELFDYVYQISQKLNGDNLIETRNLQMKLKLAQYPQKNIEEIVRVLQAQAYEGPMLQKLESAATTLDFLTKFMMRPKLFEQRCRQKIVSFLFEMLKYTQISDIFNDLRDDRIIGVRLNKLPENAVLLGRLCFSVILATIVTTGVMILRNKTKQNMQLCFQWLRFAILVIAFLCFVTVIVTTLFLSFNFWVKKGCTQLINDPNLCYDQFSDLFQDSSRGICRILAPESGSKRYRKFSPFTSEGCQSYYDQFNQEVRPYFLKNETYFYDLMVSSVQEIHNQARRYEILEKIQTLHAKAPLVSIMKDMEAHLAFFLKIEEEIQEQNINFTKFFEEILELYATNATNGAQAIRQICQALSIILGLILFIIDITNWLFEYQKNQYLSIQGNSMSELPEVDHNAYAI